MKKKQFILTFAWSSLFAFFTAACSDDDDNNGSTSGPAVQTEQYVIAASSTEATYLLQAESITGGSTLTLTDAVEGESSTHWLFPQGKYAYGLRYQQGNSGVCTSFILGADGKLQKRSAEMEMPRFTAFGTYNQYIILGAAAATANYAPEDVAKQHPLYGLVYNVIDAEQQRMSRTTIVTEDWLGNGEYCTVSGFIPVGSKIYTAICPSGYSSYGIEQGKAAGFEDLVTTGRDGSRSIANTCHPDGVAIGIYEGVNNFGQKPSKIVSDNRISQATSRYRSQYYSTMALGEDNYIYVFSNSHTKANSDPRNQTTLPAGVRRFNTATDTFDEDYYYDLEAVTEAALGQAHSFFQVWHVADNKFLMELYDNPVPDYTYNAINTFGVFDAENGTFALLENFPSASRITDIGRFVYVENGKAYIPVTLKDEDPAIYVIDVAARTATRGRTVKADGGIAAVSKMHN